MGDRRAVVRDRDCHGCVPGAVPLADGIVCTEGGRAPPRHAASHGQGGAPTMSLLSSNIDAIAPMLCLVLGALAAMAAEAFRRKGEHMPIGWFGTIVLVGAALSSVFLWDRKLVAFDVIAADNFGLFVTLILVAVGLLTVMFSSQVIHRDGLPAGEYYALVLFSIAGMMMMATATDLLVIFIALEILSLAVYVLTGIRRDNPQGTEAAFQYFLLGAFSSAFFLYGFVFA